MNSTHSKSDHITRMQAIDLIDAADFALRSNMPLNRVLHFNLTNTDVRPQEFISTFTKLAGDWLRLKKEKRAHIWIIEHPPAASLNLHLLIHVPDKLMSAFAKMERTKWLRRRSGLDWQAQKLGIRKGKKNRPVEGGELLVNLERMIGYMLKGADEETCNALKIDHVKQGVVEGKRIGVAESIGRLARQKAGYVPPSGTRDSLLFWWRFIL